jgi:hypothetical protein
MSRLLSTRTNVKTRKPHRCCFCLTAIAAGELCNYQTIADGKDFFAHYTHPECDAYASAHWQEHYEYDLGMDGPEFSRIEAAQWAATRVVA